MAFDPIVFNMLKRLSKKIIDPKDLYNLIDSDQTQDILPGTLSYINGKLVYWDIYSTSISNKFFGNITNVKTIETGRYLITLDQSNDYSKYTYVLLKRNDENGIPQDLSVLYKFDLDNTLNDFENNKIVIEAYDYINNSIIDPGENAPQVGDLLYQAGSWKMVLSETTEINTSTTQYGLTSEYMSTQVTTLIQQIDILEKYKTALENAGYTEDDPEYVKTVNQLNYYIAEKNFYEALLNCSTCDPNDETTWTDEVKAAKTALDEAQNALNVPPPSTKEIIIKSIDKIGLSVMGSIDIYMTGTYEDPPSPTTTSMPDWIENLEYTDVNTSNFRGVNQGFVGMNEDLGVNYAEFKGSYDANQGGTGYVKFIIDVAKVAGIESQRQNYKYEAFSALFKIKERNFWDYTGGSKTWQYFVNMTPLTNDYTSPNYGKYQIYCEVKAYKDYHNAVIGARWFATLNKFQGF